MGTTVAAALSEAQVLISFGASVNATGCEGSDFIGEEVRVVRAVDALGDLGLGFLCGMYDELLAFDEGPFNTFFVTVDLDRFAVLAGDIEKRTVDEAGEIGVFEFDVATLDRVGGSVALVHFFADRSRAEAGDILGLMASDTEKWADAVRGVVHGRESGPVAGPTVHVLLVGGFEELEFAEFAVIVELFHKEELASVNDSFHHHVLEAGGGAELDDCFTVLDGGRHGDGAGDVLASLEGGDGLLGVIGNG